MNPIPVAGLFLLSLAVGAYGTLIGAGGGFILVPILVFLYPHESPAHLTAISLAVVLSNAVSGSVSYYTMRIADYKSGWVLGLSTVPGAVAGALLVGSVPRRDFALLLGCLLMSGCCILLLRPQARLPLLARSRFSVKRHLIDARGRAVSYRFNLALASGFTALIGFLSSLLGIGGGPILVPLLSVFFSFPAQIDAATSLLVLGIMSGIGTATHAVLGDYASLLPQTILMAVGVLAGAPMGATISRYVRGPAVMRLLAIAGVLAGVRLFLSNL